MDIEGKYGFQKFNHFPWKWKGRSTDPQELPLNPPLGCIEKYQYSIVEKKNNTTKKKPYTEQKKKLKQDKKKKKKKKMNKKKKKIKNKKK